MKRHSNPKGCACRHRLKRGNPTRDGVSDPGHAVGSNAHSHGLTDNGHTHAVTTTAHGHTVTDGGHTHTLTAQALSTLPPYYALCFIMKL